MFVRGGADLKVFFSNNDIIYKEQGVICSSPTNEAVFVDVASVDDVHDFVVASWERPSMFHCVCIKNFFFSYVVEFSSERKN